MCKFNEKNTKIPEVFFLLGFKTDFFINKSHFIHFFTCPLNANINESFTILIESIDLASDKMTGDCQKIKWKSISSNRNYLRIIKKCMPQFLEPMPWKVQLDSFTDEIIFKLELAQFELARHDHEILNQGHFE